MFFIKSEGEGSRGGVVVGHTSSGKPIILKSSFFVKSDAHGHKYIRKYKSHGKWVYVYHEAGKPGRVIPVEAVNHLKRLADHGHRPAINLLSDKMEHDESKIDLLRQLHARGHRPATEWLEHHAIPTEVPQRPRDEFDVEVGNWTADRAAALQKIDEAVFSHLRGHANSEFTIKLREGGVDLASVTQAFDEAAGTEKTQRAFLLGIRAAAEKIRNAHAEITTTPSNGTAAQAGGYGNLALHRAFTAVNHGHATINADIGNKLEADNNFAGDGEAFVQRVKELKRTIGERLAREELERRQRAELEAREAAERAERARAEAAGARERHSDSIEKMARYFGKVQTDEVKDKLALGIQKFFGSDFSFEEFESGLQSNPKVVCRIGDEFYDGLFNFGRSAATSTSFDLGFVFQEKTTGRRITYASRTIYKNDDGAIRWNNGSFNRASNADLKAFPGMANGLYGGVEKFLLKVSRNWTGTAKENTRITIGSCANGGWGNGYKGALIWAKHYFDWSGSSPGVRGSGNDTTGHWAREWNNQLDRARDRLNIPSDVISELKSKVSGYKYPYQYVKTGLKINKEEALRLIGSSSLDWDFEQVFKKARETDGKIDIGEIILIDSGMSWSGENYINRTTGRAGHLNELRKRAYEDRRAVVSGSAQPATTSTQPVLSQPTLTEAGSRARTRLREMWDNALSRTPTYEVSMHVFTNLTANSNTYVVNQNRLDIMSRWSLDKVNLFLLMSNSASTSPNGNIFKVSTAGRRKIKELRDRLESEERQRNA